MAQQPPDDQPPSWVANPGDYQAPPAPTAYQDWTPESEKQEPPESFVPIRPAHVQQGPLPQAPNDGGFQISFGSYTFSGWYAVVLSILVLGIWTSLGLYTFVSTYAGAQEFGNAPLCVGPLTDSCRGDFAAPITYDLIPGGSRCIIHADPKGVDWQGEFPVEACKGMPDIDASARVWTWRGQVVWIQRRDFGHLDESYWATDSAVGVHGQAQHDILLPLFVDIVYVVALVLALIYRFVNPFRSQLPR